MSANPVVDETNPPDKEPVEGQDPAESTPEEPKGPTVAELQAEVARLSRVNKDLETSEKFWHDRFKSSAKEPERPEKQPEPQFDADAFIEAQTKGDAEKMRQELKKLGMIDRQEVESRLAQIEAETRAEREATQRIAELTARYPDLADRNSDLFKTASRVMEERVNENPDAPKNRNFVEECIKDARLEVLERLVSEKGQAPDGERERRIGQQAGAVGRTRTMKTGPVALTPQQQKIAAAHGLSEDEYREQQQRVFVNR